MSGWSPRAISRRAPLRAALLAAVGMQRRRTEAAAIPAFDVARALRDVERLVAFGPRPAGSAALARTYIATELRAAGWRRTPWTSSPQRASALRAG